MHAVLLRLCSIAVGGSMMSPLSGSEAPRILHSLLQLDDERRTGVTRSIPIIQT